MPEIQQLKSIKGILDELNNQVGHLFGVRDIKFAVIISDLIYRFEASYELGTYRNSEQELIIMKKYKERPVEVLFRLAQVAYKSGLDVDKDFEKIVKKSGLTD